MPLESSPEKPQPLRVVVHAVKGWIERMGESSVVYAFRVLSADGATVHAEGKRVNIKLDPRTLRPSPWTDEARAVAAPLMA